MIRAFFAFMSVSGFAVLMSGCFGESTMRCEDVLRYATSQSIAPLQVPDGLSVPDESESLRIPSGEPLEVPDPETVTECLEGPPDFFDEAEVVN